MGLYDGMHRRALKRPVTSDDRLVAFNLLLDGKALEGLSEVMHDSFPARQRTAVAVDHHDVIGHETPELFNVSGCNRRCPEVRDLPNGACISARLAPRSVGASHFFDFPFLTAFFFTRLADGVTLVCHIVKPFGYPRDGIVHDDPLVGPAADALTALSLPSVRAYNRA